MTPATSGAPRVRSWFRSSERARAGLPAGLGPAPAARAPSLPPPVGTAYPARVYRLPEHFSCPPALSRFAPIALLLLLATLPLVSVIGQPAAFVGDALGELPVKLWVLETFGRIGLLGGRVDNAGFPNLGVLNNPDPVGAAVTLLLRPLVGRIWAYNLLLVVQLAASMIATWALARALVQDASAALVASVTFVLTPLVLAYAVSGAVTDILNLWPYPLALLLLLRALAAPTPRQATLSGLASGALGGLGFATCPYNFIIFSAMFFPMVLLLPAALREGLIANGPAVRPTGRVAGAGLVAVAVALFLVAGSSAWFVRDMMADPSSQMSSAAVSATRHTPPFRFLEPGHRDRYVAYLADYVAVGKDQIVERVAASRFYRAFSPGFTVLGLCVVAVVWARRPRIARLWAGVAVFCVLASTGPFLPLTREVFLSVPGNPAWRLTHHALPGGNLLLEPFRYALAAAFALGLCAAVGAAEVTRRLGWGAGVGLCLLIVTETLVLSPAPFPLASATLTAPAVYTHLDRYFGPGAVLELPYFDHGTDRFNRIQFFHQLVHGRPIANEVLGFAPRYLRENQFTAKLLEIEKPTGMLKVEVTDPARVASDRAQLAVDGWAGVVVDTLGYATPAALENVLDLLAPLGTPVTEGERVLIPIR